MIGLEVKDDNDEEKCQKVFHKCKKSIFEIFTETFDDLFQTVVG